MNERLDSDSELIEELRSVLGRVDPVPRDVSDFAKTALGWRRLDADLAELLNDSALEVESAPLARSAGSVGRWLAFRAAAVSIDVEVVRDGARHSLLGQLVPPPAAATIEVQAADGTVVAAAAVDSVGRFRLALDAGGRVRLRILRHDPVGSPVETSWFSL